MVKTQVILDSDYSIIFEVNDKDWCSLSIAYNNEVTELGADSKNIVLKRIIEGLKSITKDQIVGALEGIEVKWVLSLSEKHCSLYLGIENNRKILFIQDDAGKIIARITLTNNDIQKIEDLKI
jgi:hypothetical protein